jgi:pimeloyl-ACP methyl ester carboxylesterase
MLATLITSIYHIVMTFPSMVYHGILNSYNRSITTGQDTSPLTCEKVVIFVHGRGGDPVDFNPMISMIKEKYLLPEYDLRTVYLWDTHFTTISEDVVNLRNHLSKYNDCSIVLVGLSKGGPIITEYAPTDPRVNKVITISAPLHGTKLANLIFWSSLVREDYKYGERKNPISPECDIKTYHVVPRWDHIIIPTNVAKYKDTPMNNIFHYDGYYSHQGIQYDPIITKIITNWIKD